MVYVLNTHTQVLDKNELNHTENTLEYARLGIKTVFDKKNSSFNV